MEFQRRGSIATSIAISRAILGDSGRFGGCVRGAQVADNAWKCLKELVGGGRIELPTSAL